MPEQIPYSADNTRFLESLRPRYQRRKRSDSGILLDAMLHDEDDAIRSNAAVLFGLRGYRRGFRQIERAIRDIVDQLRDEAEAEQQPGHRLLCQLLFVVGRMDTIRSHRLIEEIIRSVKNPKLRALALDATAFEEELFDLGLVVDFLAEGHHPDEMVSSLYALTYQNLARTHPEIARRAIVPLLTHETPRVRAYAVGALAVSPSNRALIAELPDDPDEAVRSSVMDALALIGFLDE